MHATPVYIHLHVQIAKVRGRLFFLFKNNWNIYIFVWLESIHFGEFFSKNKRTKKEIVTITKISF